MAENSIIEVRYTRNSYFKTRPAYRYDYGQTLRLAGFPALPSAFEVHFAAANSSTSVTQIGSDGEVVVPDVLLTSGQLIRAWLYLHDGTDDGETVYTIEIPVKDRAEPTNQEPTPVQQDAITQAIAALNAAVEQTGEDVEDAQAAKVAAESAQAAAEAAQAAAGSGASAAAQSASQAAASVSQIAGYAQTAAQAAAAAATSATDANSSRQFADQSATNAGVSERNAAASVTAAQAAKTAAETAQAAAEQSATAAGSSATSASQSATAAAGSASGASGSATAAAGSATQAAGSATAAAGSATAAAGSATDAAGSATAAAGSAAEAAQTAAGIETAGAEQVAAIEAKGEEVLESIPEDYTELTDDVNSLKSAIDSHGIRLTDIDGKVTSIPFEFGKCGVSSSGITYGTDASNRYIRTVQGQSYHIGLGDTIIVDSLAGINVRAYCFVEATSRQITLVNSSFDVLSDGRYGKTVTNPLDVGEYHFMLFKDPLETLTDTSLSERLSIQHKSYRLEVDEAEITEAFFQTGAQKDAIDGQLDEYWIDAVRTGSVANSPTDYVDHAGRACTRYIPVRPDEMIEFTCPDDSTVSSQIIYIYTYDSEMNRNTKVGTPSVAKNRKCRIDGNVAGAAYVAINFYDYNNMSTGAAKEAYYQKLRTSIRIVKRHIQPQDGNATGKLGGLQNCIIAQENEFQGIFDGVNNAGTNTTRFIDLTGIKYIIHSSVSNGLRGAFYSSSHESAGSLTINDTGTQVTDTVPDTAKYLMLWVNASTYNSSIAGEYGIIKAIEEAGPSVDATLTVEGAAADAKATGTIRDSIGTPPEVMVLMPRTWKDTNGYYYKTGHTSQYTWRSISTYRTTDKIELGQATHVYVYTMSSDDKASKIQFWDSNDAIIADYGAGASSETTLSMVDCAVPNGAVYVSYTCFGNKAGGSYISTGQETESAFDAIETVREAAGTEKHLNVSMAEQGAFYRDGIILESAAYSITEYVPCNCGDRFILNTYGTTETVYSKAYYDSQKNVLAFDHFGSGATLGIYQEERFEVDIANAKYVRFTCYGGVIDLVKISLEEKEARVVTLNAQSLDDALAAGINKGRFNSASAPDSFMLLHFSDIHGTGENLKNITEVQKYLSPVLDDTLCTGDIMASNWSNSFDFWDANSDGSILTCIGNHDVKASNAGGDGYLTNQQSEADLYGRYMEDYISGWNVEHSDTNLYYYKDYATKKIRLIVLNLLYPTSEKVTEQNTWLASALAGAKSAGYGVVIGEHYYPVSGTKINCTFSAEVNFPTAMSNPGNYMYNGDALTTYQATVQSFIDGGGNFVCWLCGHKHADYIVYHPDYPKQVFIGVGGALFTDRANELNHTSDMRRVRGTRSQDCMNVLSIDPTDKKIKIIRIGCDRDFLSRHRGVLVLDYSTNPATVVYND